MPPALTLAAQSRDPQPPTSLPGLHPLFQEGHSCQNLSQGEALFQSPGKVRALGSRTFMMLVPHFMLDETQQSLLHWGGPVKLKAFLPGLQLQAGRGCSGLISNTIRHLYSSSEFTEGFCCTLNLPCVLPPAVAALSLCTPKESGSPLGRLPLT